MDAAMTPLVTVVTSTWQRPNALRDYAIASVDRQAYPEIEHIVVIDGPDDYATMDMLDNLGYSFGPSRRRMVILGRNWTSHSGDGGAGATCRLVGAWMAAGSLITYLDDDVTYDAQHIGEMVEHFDDQVEFVTCAFTFLGQPFGPSSPPGLNRTDTSTIMHRSLVLRDAGGFHPDGYTGDGNMVERWLAAGKTWAFKHNPTVHHPTGHHYGGPMA